MRNAIVTELSEATCDRCFASLTDAERKCVDLVAQGYLAKEIARQHDVSVHSVNKIIREVRRRLGPLPNGIAVTKPVLARAYREWDARQNSAEQGSQRIGPYSAPLPRVDDTASDEVLDRDPDARVDQGGSRADNHEPYLSGKHVAALLDLVSLPTAERRYNDLKWRSALIAIGIIACMTMIAAGSTASLLAAIADLIRK